MPDAPLRPRLLNTRDAAEYLGTNERTLEGWRAAKRYGLPYVRVGKLIRYKISDLETWIEKNTVVDIPVEV